MSESTAGNQPRGLEQKWKVLISIMFGIFMIILDATVVNVAFPTLRREFGATLADAQWVLSIYVLSLGVTTPVSGYLADRFGIKRVYLFGLAVFVVGSSLCGLAPSLGWLIAARALQGFGGGVAQPLGPANSTVPSHRRSRVQRSGISGSCWCSHRLWVRCWVGGWWMRTC